MANSNTLDGNTSSHGQQKKTLAGQLDRLDTIIDALDEALPGAVADAVQQAVSAAVKQAACSLVRTASAGVRRVAAGIWGLAGWARRHPVKLAVASVVGLAVGAAGYLGGPAVSSGMLGLAGALSSLVGSTLAPVFRLLSGWQSPDART
jgi:hypothetical protein